MQFLEICWQHLIRSANTFLQLFLSSCCYNRVTLSSYVLTPVKVCKEFLQLTWNVNFGVFLKVCVCFVTKTMRARLSTHMELCSGLWSIAASPKFCWRLKEVMTILTRAYLLGAGDKWKSVSLGVKTAHDKILQFSIYSPVTTPIYTNILSNLKMFIF